MGKIKQVDVVWIENEKGVVVDVPRYLFVSGTKKNEKGSVRYNWKQVDPPAPAKKAEK